MTGPTRLLALVLILVAPVLLVRSPAPAPAQEDPLPPSPISEEHAEGFELVGHHPLGSRGMNAAIAMYGDYAYIGNRTDGSGNHPMPGVLVADVSDPATPEVVGEIGPPNEGNPGETSRELRVWPEEKLLLVLNFRCEQQSHACNGPSVPPTIRFYDLTGANAASPLLVATYPLPLLPHEMFLWTDGDERALLYLSAWKAGVAGPDLIVTDISRAREGVFSEVASWNGNSRFSSAFRSQNVVRLHSMGVSADGTRTYVAYQGAGFLILDSSDVAAGFPSPELRLLTPIGSQPTWGSPGAHSAIEVPERDLALTTDEVYGNRPGGGFQSLGCPWGWLRLIDTSDEAAPTVVGEYKIPQNEAAYCGSVEGSDPLDTWFTSYSSHNPTIARGIAFVTWHSGGLHAISLKDPSQPERVGVYLPRPLPTVATEDPALSSGRNKVVMWSYPIVHRGLIYVIDLRNGLYVLRYTGPNANKVAKVRFAEGNSYLGD